MKWYRRWNPDGEETAGNGNGTENGQPYRDPNGKHYGKKVYLTFDDGPSDNTDKILTSFRVRCQGHIFCSRI